jgi:ABC-type polar amino acid transport system ATPase subunit
MVVVTHEVGFARESSDRVVLLDGGRKLEEGPSREVLSNPREERSRAFLNRVIH